MNVDFYVRISEENSGTSQRRRGLKQLDRNLQFSDWQLQISDREGGSKFSKWVIFSANCCIFERKFPGKKTILRQVKIWGRGPLEHQDPCHNVSLFATLTLEVGYTQYTISSFKSITTQCCTCDQHCASVYRKLHSRIIKCHCWWDSSGCNH